MKRYNLTSKSPILLLLVLAIVLVIFAFWGINKNRNNEPSQVQIKKEIEIKRGIEGIQPTANNWGLNNYCLKKDVIPGEIITYYHKPGVTVYVRTVKEQNPEVWVCDKNGKPLANALDAKEDYGFSEYYSKNTMVIRYLVKKGSVIGIGTK